MELSRTYCDNLTEEYPKGNNFLKSLRNQITEVDPDMSNAIYQFHTNMKRDILYANSTSTDEKYLNMLFIYLHKLPFISNQNFSIPKYGIEAISFRVEDDSDVSLPPNEVLKEIISKLEV